MSKIKQFIKNISPFNNRTDMPKILYVIKVILIFWVFKFASELVGEGIVLGVHFACGKNPLNGDMFDANTITLIMYFGYGLLIGIVMLLWKLFQKKSMAELGFTKNFGTYFIGALAGAVLITISALAVTFTGAIKFNGVFDHIDVKMVLLMIGCYMFQGAMEEVLCRGVVQQLLIKQTPVPVAVGISAALFTIPHLSNMQGESPAIVMVSVVNLILISLIFSALTIRFKSIWAACGLHSFWNYILANIMGLNLSGNDEIIAAVFDMRTAGENVLNGGMYGIEGSIITTVVLAAAFALCCVSLKKSTQKALSNKAALSI